MLRNPLDLKKTHTVNEAILLYVLGWVFFSAIQLSFQGAIGDALTADSVEVAQSAYRLGFWINPAIASIACIALLHNLVWQKKLSLDKYWHLYTLTLLFCLTLGLTVGLLPAALVAMLEKDDS